MEFFIIIVAIDIIYMLFAQCRISSKVTKLSERVEELEIALSIKQSNDLRKTNEEETQVTKAGTWKK